jgi:hypothetical protein
VAVAELINTQGDGFGKFGIPKSRSLTGEAPSPRTLDGIFSQSPSKWENFLPRKEFVKEWTQSKSQSEFRVVILFETCLIIFKTIFKVGVTGTVD